MELDPNPPDPFGPQPVNREDQVVDRSVGEIRRDVPHETVAAATEPCADCMKDRRLMVMFGFGIGMMVGCGIIWILSRDG